MKRKLLLIGNPGIQGVNYTPSVNNVLKRYKEFFKSEVGGYWTDGENGEITGDRNVPCHPLSEYYSNVKSCQVILH